MLKEESHKVKDTIETSMYENAQIVFLSTKWNSKCIFTNAFMVWKWSKQY